MRKFLWIMAGLAVVGTLSFMAYQRSGRPTTLDHLYDEYHARGVQMNIQAPFSGAVLVARDGEVIFERAYGFADPSRTQELAVDSRFLLGAAAKPVTAALVLQQVDAGVLALDGTIPDYLPDFPVEPGGRITLHHLLSHTAGLPRDTVDPEGLQLVADPGEQYAFSNYGYELLVSILEAATGQGYGELVRTGIVEPLGLEHTGYAEGDALAAEVAAAMRFESHPPPIALVSMSPGRFEQARAPGSGEFYTSVRDLHRLVRALRDGELLSAASTEAMFTPVLAGYGYGWARNREWAITRNPDAPVWTHVGRLAGYNSLVGMFDDGLTLVVLGNVEPLGIATILHDSWLAANGLAEVEGTLKHPSLSNPEKFAEGGGIEAFERYYEELSERAGHPIEPDGDFCVQVVRLALRGDNYDEALAFAERAFDRRWIGNSPGTLNILGYQFLGDERYDEARRLFELNVERYPDYTNGFDSLGDCHERAGNLEAARENYSRALELGREQNDSNVGFYERRIAGVDEALRTRASEPSAP